MQREKTVVGVYDFTPQNVLWIMIVFWGYLEQELDTTEYAPICVENRNQICFPHRTTDTGYCVARICVWNEKYATWRESLFVSGVCFPIHVENMWKTDTRQSFHMDRKTCGKQTPDNLFHTLPVFHIYVGSLFMLRTSRSIYTWKTVGSGCYSYE